MIEETISVPHIPPSLNEVASKGSHWKWTRAKAQWHDILVPVLEATSLPLCGAVHAEGQITFPDRRKRDQGNYRSTLEKFLGDALQLAGILDEDDWHHFTFGDLSYNYEKGVSRTTVALFPR